MGFTSHDFVRNSERDVPQDVDFDLDSMYDIVLYSDTSNARPYARLEDRYSLGHLAWLIYVLAIFWGMPLWCLYVGAILHIQRIGVGPV